MPKAHIVKGNVAVEKFQDGEGSEFPMSKHMYLSEWKTDLFRTLCQKGDAGARVLNPGIGEPMFMGANVAARIKDCPGARLVRGFKIMHIPLPSPRWGGGDAWSAHFHVVVAHPNMHGREVYECVTLPACQNDLNAPFVFVPSSLAHPEISDNDILSNDWLTGKVFGGNLNFVEVLLCDFENCGRRSSLYKSDPRALRAVKKQNIVIFPYFQEWHRARHFSSPMDELDQLAEHMGFLALEDNQTIGINSNMTTQDLRQVIEKSRAHALVDPLQTLEVQKRCSLLAETTVFSTTEIRDFYFAHYDSQKTIIDGILSHRWEMALESKNFTRK